MKLYKRWKNTNTLGKPWNEQGNLRWHKEDLVPKCELISREIDAIGAKWRARQEEITVKLKLSQACLMTALTCGLKAWANIRKKEMKELEEKNTVKLWRRYFNS